jgi:ankyrin repeat protein
MEARPGKRAREELAGQEQPQAAAQGGSSSSSSSSSSSTSSSSSSSSSSSASAAPAPFRGPAADSVLGELLIDVIGIVAAMGFAAEVAHCLYLCGETWHKGDKGATNDMLVRSLERQCGASAARAAEREDFAHPTGGRILGNTTQLIRAALLNNLPRVLQLLQLGAPLELKDKSCGWTALQWACRQGHKHVARALLDGKYEGRGAEVDAGDKSGMTPLMWASYEGHKGIVRLLLARGARQELQDSDGDTALHTALYFGDHASIVALLCAAPGAAAALALRNRDGRTPLGLAVDYGSAACETVLRTHGAQL